MTHMTQTASFSKHRWIKLKSKVPVHQGNSPVNPYSSPVLSQMPPVPWLAGQGILEPLLPVSQGCMPTSVSWQGPSLS